VHFVRERSNDFDLDKPPRFFRNFRAMKTTIRLFFALLALFGLFAAGREADAVIPPPDGGYPGFNTAEGQNALLSLNTSTGLANTAVGWFSLKSNVDGSFNTALGAGTLLLNTAGQNTAIGAAALLSNTIGDANTAIGAAALQNNTEGNFNTANGAFALSSNTEGTSNTAIGHQALNDNINGQSNTAVGRAALPNNTTGSQNTAVGTIALLNNATGIQNTALGSQALQANVTGERNTAVGHSALFGVTGSGNTAIGEFAGVNLTTGNGNVCIGEGVGGTAGQNNITRIRNIGSTPIIDGTTVVIGSTGGVGDGILGYPASSRRYKEDIKPMDKASETLFALKPVTYRARRNIDPNRIKHYGLIAEEVATVDPDLVVYNPEGKPETLRFDSISAMLLNEFLKEHRKVQKLEATVADLAAELRQVKAQVQTNSPILRVAAKNP
jgi:trimeric autotransporter adhesin